MARVQGVREKVHLPIYDSVNVEPEKQLRDAESSSTLKFFVNVQGKTKLQTNLQSASLLPHYNTFEARAMRVVISDLPPKFSDEECETEDPIPVMNDPAPPAKPAQFLQEGKFVGEAGANPVSATNKLVFANLTLPLDEVMDLLAEARESGEDAEFKPDDEGVELVDVDGNPLAISTTGTPPPRQIINNAGLISLSVADLEAMVQGLEKKAPPMEQIRPNNGSGNLISRFIYNTVTTLYVGEKVMIQMPTWFFPGGAGAYSETKSITHGEPSPLATFRFAEPIFVDRQQNFRVEIEIPDSDVLKEMQKIYGPFNIWVVLDGFMTRDVQ